MDNYKKLRGSETVYGESIKTHRFELFGKYEFDFLDDFELNYSYSNTTKIVFTDLIFIKQIKKFYFALTFKKKIFKT